MCVPAQYLNSYWPCLLLESNPDIKMSFWSSSIGESLAHVRHYPLDIDLPFERYEHRQLTVRDILVHRIMSKLLFPMSKGLAHAFDTQRSKENGLHNFGPIKQHDRTLARDLEILRKMLATCSTTDLSRDPFVKPVRANFFRGFGLRRVEPPHNFHDLLHEGDANVRVTVGEEILDLVRRHYFETDDTCTRIWLRATEPIMLSSYSTLPAAPQAKHTHAASAQERKRRDSITRGHDEKKWYHEDTEHLKSLQMYTRTAHSLKLYDGGARVPPLRQSLLSARASRIQYQAMRTELGDPVLLSSGNPWEQVVKGLIYPWPEGGAPRRLLQVPSWQNWRQKHQWFRDRAYAPPVDFASGRTGRGMDRDGIWATGCSTEEEGDRGRSTRCGRRRASSEPPPDVFTSARLPWSFHPPREMLIFPKMNLATMDRRARRRSLSRTRIAEMFDWNTVLMAQPTKEMPTEPLEQSSRTNVRGEPRTLPRKPYEPACVNTLELSLETMRLSHSIGWREWSDDISTAIERSAVPIKACCRGTAAGSCANCTSMGHVTSHCSKPCGFCGAPSTNTPYPAGCNATFPRSVLSRFGDGEKQAVVQNENLHMASECPVATHNRCKCGPFPQYHVAAKCPIVCSRKCGNDHPPGHFKHKGAMTCTAKCCMCGTKGHSGQQCKLKRCRCGEAHLGQDCRWQVECRVKGCGRFLCGVHCIECGMSRAELDEGLSFCGGRCPSCLAETEGATADGISLASDEGDGQKEERPQKDRGAHMQQVSQKRVRRKNVRKRRDPERKTSNKEEFPWYAPLQPRTRPIVTSKPGKRS